MLGIDWLTTNHPMMDYENKWVLFQLPDQESFWFQGVGVVPPPFMVSVIQAYRLLKKGCQGFLCRILDSWALELKLEDISVVKDFLNVFPKELPSSLVEREIEFGINAILGTQFISREHY